MGVKYQTRPKWREQVLRPKHLRVLTADGRSHPPVVPDEDRAVTRSRTWKVIVKLSNKWVQPRHRETREKGENAQVGREPSGKGAVFVMTVATGGVRPLTPGSSHDNFPAWSPNGNRIAFTRFSDSDYELYTIKPDGTDAPFDEHTGQRRALRLVTRRRVARLHERARWVRRRGCTASR